MNRRRFITASSVAALLGNVAATHDSAFAAEVAPGWRFKQGRRRQVVGLSESIVRCQPNLLDCTLMIGSAPIFAGQPEANTSMTIAGYRGKVEKYVERSALHVPMLRASVTSDLVDDYARVQVTVTHAVTLQERSLERGVQESPEPLNDDERKAYCLATKSLDYEDEGFAEWPLANAPT